MNKTTQNQIDFSAFVFTITGIKLQIGNSISSSSPMLIFESNPPSNIKYQISNKNIHVLDYPTSISSLHGCLMLDGYFLLVEREGFFPMIGDLLIEDCYWGKIFTNILLQSVFDQ